MKTRNVDLTNTPLLTNHIYKYILLEAPTLPELKKKVKEYELILVRALTNAYKLSNLSLDKNGSYTILPDGNYQSSIFLNFSGIKKEEITNPEKTLQYIKHLTALESKHSGKQSVAILPSSQKRESHKSITIPIEIKPDDTEIDVISTKQKQLLEHLISETNLVKISFFIVDRNKNADTNKKIIYLKAEYNCMEVIQKQDEHSDPEEPENR